MCYTYKEIWGAKGAATLTQRQKQKAGQKVQPNRNHYWACSIVQFKVTTIHNYYIYIAWASWLWCMLYTSIGDTQTKPLDHACHIVASDSSCPIQQGEAYADVTIHESTKSYQALKLRLLLYFRLWDLSPRIHTFCLERVHCSLYYPSRSHPNVYRRWQQGP